MTKKFDGVEVITALFGDLPRFKRFFSEKGEGFTKTSECTCCNDWSTQDLYCAKDTQVWIKKG